MLSDNNIETEYELKDVLNESNVPSNNYPKSAYIYLNLFVLAGLLILNLITYSRSFNCYFLADDFIHIAYLNDVFHGHPEKLLENFTSNWMHAWGTKFYRPLISLTLALDYFIGNGGAKIFHITNFLYHYYSSALLYFIGLKLFSNYKTKQRIFCSILASALFSTNPLHTEVVSWVIGRVDSVCLCFFLTSYFLYLSWLNNKKIFLLLLSLFSFCLSLASKEMAVILPILLFMTGFYLEVNSNEDTNKGSRSFFLEKIQKAFYTSLPFFCVLILYFCLRYFALGNIVGGYDGSIGQGFNNSLYERIISCKQIFMPFNTELFSPFDKLRKNLILLYQLSAFLFLVRIIFFQERKKQILLILFCASWFILALLPALPVLNLNESLQCSRFVFFATAPLSFLLVSIICPLWHTDQSGKRNFSSFIQFISILLSISFLTIFTLICTKNNLAWAHASSELRHFRESIENVAKNTKQNEKIAILNIPQRKEGAHMLYNAAMLSVLFSEPLTKPSIYPRIISFEAPTYGDSRLINASRLKELVQTNAPIFYSWDTKNSKLVKLDISPVFNLSASFWDLTNILKQKNIKNIENLKSTETDSLILSSPELTLDPLAIDIIAVKINTKELNSSPKQDLIKIIWTGKNQNNISEENSLVLPLLNDSKEHTYYFHVSEFKSWYYPERIQKLELILPLKYTEKISTASIELIKHGTLRPKLTFLSDNFSNSNNLDGIISINNTNISLSADGSQVKNLESLVLEISEPNSWFEHFSGTLHDNKFAPSCFKKLVQNSKKATFNIEKDFFPQPAYYELRVIGIDKKGNIVGFTSCPIYLQVNW